MTRRAASLVLFVAVAVAVPIAVMLWYQSPAAGPFALYPRLAAAYRSVGLDMALIQRNQLNHLVRACLAEPQLWWTLVYAGAPTIAAALAAWRLAGSRGLADFAGRYNPLRHMTVHRATAVYAVALGVGASVVLGQLLLAATVGLRLKMPALGLGYALGNLALGLVINQGGLLEEGGWRGFLQPCLQGLWRRPIAAAVVVGLIWAAWHLPLDVLRGAMFKDPAGYVVEFGEFTLYCVTTAIVHAWLLTLARGSIWPSIMFHGTGNSTEWLIAQAAGDTAPFTGFLIQNIPAALLATLIVAFWRPSRDTVEAVALPQPDAADQPAAKPAV